MTARRLASVVATGALAVGLGWLMFSFLEQRLSTPPPDADPVAPAAQPAAAVAPHIAALLYFVSADGTLLEARSLDVPLGDTPAAQARALIEAQLAATPPDGLTRAVPEGVTVRGVFLTGRDDAYVDLDGTFVSALPGGSHNELMAAYAVVSVLTTNLATVQRVQILIDGREVETLTGHVDLREPLRKNEGLIRVP